MDMKGRPMSSSNESSDMNRARRHFLGLTAAAAARIAAIGSAVSALPHSMAAAAWWNPGHPGGGNANGRGKGHGGPMCLLSGTAILTPRGQVCIEDLRIGDLVDTVRGEALPVKWIGRRAYRRSSQMWNEDVVPIRIRRFALDDSRPYRDLFVSPGHAFYIDDVLIRAQDLVNGRSITREVPDARDTIEYYQIVFPTHEVVLAEGAPVESFLLENANYEGFTNFCEFARLYPGDHDASMAPFAPFVGYGGREHLKALLRLATGGLVKVPSPLQDAYEKISERGQQY